MLPGCSQNTARCDKETVSALRCSREEPELKAHHQSDAGHDGGGDLDVRTLENILSEVEDTGVLRLVRIVNTTKELFKYEHGRTELR